MSIDISLIPQERIKDLVSTLDNIQNNLSNNIVHRTGDETIDGNKTFSQQPRYSGTTTASSAQNSTALATVGYLNNPNLSLNVVHRSGNETINGTKTFTSTILAQGDITLGTSTNTWGKMVQFRDTTGKRIARIQTMAVTTTNNRVGMWVNNADNSVERGIYVDSDGTTYAPHPTTTQDSSNKIATTAWVNNLDNSVVHKTGNETITGVKTFNDSNVITNKEFISLTSSPYGQFRAIDGNYGFFIRNDGVSTYFLLTNSNDQYGSWNSLRPLTIENASGKVRINNSVVSGFVKETWSSGTQWYRIWSDGWIEQGGYASWNGAWTTLTFNRPFTTTNYYINGGGYRSDSSPYQCMIDFKDWGTSSCSVWSSDDNTSNPCVMKWYACGY